ncbi:glycoside hydrolase [Rhypophila decipiens]|uniref:Glycoside hydrolase n=1 Tax=Rhypophila decipiens TaxID=261697 RepID=A0AAN6Y4G2_9PEZI|nr:glycoside hydrolase [Rhypophila decipiens]
MIFFKTVSRLAGAVLVAGLPRAVVAAGSNNYTLTTLYDQWNFFKEFDFQTFDPANGFVKYVDAVTANKDKLAGYTDGLIYLGVDHTNKSTMGAMGGRPSVRVNSTKQFNGGLFVVDIVHMPSGKTDNDSCGLWPAFWLSGSTWPVDGEIDIIEGRNTQSTPINTFHTGDNCTDMSNEGSREGTILRGTVCKGGTGCRQDATIKGAYGADLNSAGGGIFVLEWAEDHLSQWFFGRDTKMPASVSAAIASISSATPDYSSSVPPKPALQIDVSGFGTPITRFNSGPKCSIKDNMRNNNIIINTDFCGWAGKAEEWGTNEICSKLGSSCDEYVANHPEAFKDAYWLIRSISVYQKSGDDAPGATGNSTTSRHKREQNGIGGFRKEL